MSHVLTEIGPCKKRAEFQLNTEDVQNGFNDVYQEITETINIPGFRRGKVPRTLIAKKYGKDILGEVKQKLLVKSFQEMVEAESIEVISQPQFDEKEKEFAEGQEFSFSVAFEVKPDIELPEYKGMSLVKKIRKVTDAHYEDAKKNLLRSHARLEEVAEGEIQKGDFAMLQIEAIDEDGTVLHHNNLFPCLVEDRDGEGRLDIFTIANLEDELLGQKKGETREITFEAPENFAAKEELAGKTLTLKVDVDSIRRPVSPEFGKEFLAELGFDEEEKFKETLVGMLDREFDNRAREEMKELIYSFLNEKVESPLPEDAVKNHCDYLVNVRLYDMMRAGTPREETEALREGMQEEMIEQARKEIKVGFALSKIAEVEKVLVTEREVGSRIVALAQQRGMAPEKMKEELEKNHELSALRSQIKEEKTLDLLIKKAEVTEEVVDMAAEKSAEEGEKKAAKKAAPKKAAAKKAAPKKAAKKKDEGEEA